MHRQRKDSAEVMEMFREVNGDPAASDAARGKGKPPSAKDSAAAMEDFREVNGEQGRGAPPSAKDSAEVMEMFPQVNGDPATSAPHAARVSRRARSTALRRWRTSARSMASRAAVHRPAPRTAPR
ncbi:MAG: hypothetical protein IPQ07_07075 [Myxococcales bacterium]|nr:hypothetical protein [Myxococcales bacterium]